MMNILALGLVLTSLLTAGFFNPTPEKSKDEVIVKEGHRVVVVEYEKDDGNTKVSISPQDQKIFVANGKDEMSEKIMEEGKEKTKEASSSVQEDEETRYKLISPTELVCDAYGKCKEKISSAMGTTKEKAHETAQKVSEAQEMAKDKAHETAQKAFEAKEDAKGKVHEMAQKAYEAQEAAKKEAQETAQKAHEKAQEAKESVTEASTKATEKIAGKATGIKETASEKAKEGRKELSEILQHAREVVVDVFDYVFSTERVAQVAGILHLMGFAAAYGMCVWVTFASSYVLAGSLPRQQFAMVQSRMYPVYFKAMAYSVGMALLGHLIGERKRLSPLFGVGMFQGFNLMASLGMVLGNLLFFEPRANKVMQERMKKEKEEGKGKEGHSTDRAVDSTAEAAGRGSVTTAAQGKKSKEAIAAKSEMMRLSETLQRLNSYSSFLNVMTLMSLTWHLAHLGQRLHVTC